MGMYTEFKAKIELDYDHEDIDSVIRVLCYMLYISDGELPKEIEYVNDPLFETSRWTWMFRSSSAYFDDHEPSYLKGGTLYIEFDIKNYDNEIEKFLKWIRQYSISRGKVGTYRYEEDDSDSDVIFTENGYEILLINGEYNV